MKEADISINGVKLSEGQSMTLRVAASDFFVQMQNPVALGDDEHGRRMTVNYLARLKEILTLMAPTARESGPFHGPQKVQLLTRKGLGHGSASASAPGKAGQAVPPREKRGS